MSYGSSFCGSVRELPGVALDDFTGESLQARAFFLSHTHADHTKGLHSLELRRALTAAPHVRLYMSRLSAKIVHRDSVTYPHSPLLDRITELDLETIHIKLPAMNSWKEEYISVTAIPAGHCLGSVMFLFRTSQDQNILFTGDFRISENDVSKFAQLHRKTHEPITIHSLYIDTTFLDPKYMHFPKRSDCMEQLQKRIEEWLKADSRNQVALSISARFGYEFAFIELSKRLSMKIFVDAEKWEFYSDIDCIKLAVTNEQNSTRIHACRNMSEGHKHDRCGLNNVDPQKLLFIRMSAQRFKHYEPETSPIQSTSDTRLDVCFPTHCSSSEIRAFVSYYSPERIEGFPNDYYSFSGNRECDLNEKLDRKSLTPKKTPPKSTNKRKKSSPFDDRPGKVDKKENITVLKKIFKF